MSFAKVLLATDLHVGAIPNTTTFWPIHQGTHSAAALASLLQEARDYNATIVGGDMSATGKENDLKAAFSSASALDSIATAFFIPGNHDRYKTDFYGLGSEYFDPIFETLWPHGRLGAGALIVDNPDFPDLDLVFVGADMTLRTEDDIDQPIRARRGNSYGLGQGHAREDTVKALVKRTNDLLIECRGENRRAAAVWVLHFPPVKVDRKRRLVDWNNVLTAACDAKIPLVLTGHIHEHKRFHPASATQVWCSGAATVADVSVFGFGRWKRTKSVSEIKVDVEMASSSFRLICTKKVYAESGDNAGSFAPCQSTDVWEQTVPFA